MVKLVPVALPTLPAMPPLRSMDPTQSFEAMLAAAGEADLQSQLGTLEFGELGMLGRHGAVAGGEGELFDQVRPGAPDPVEPTLTAAPAIAGALPPTPQAASTADTVLQAAAGVVEATTMTAAKHPTQIEPPTISLVTGLFLDQTPSTTGPNSRELAKAATPPLRPRSIENGRQFANPVRIDVGGVGAELQVLLVAPGLAGEGRQRIRALIADMAAELGLHLSEFTFNDRLVDAPSIGALGAAHGRIRG